MYAAIQLVGYVVVLVPLAVPVAIAAATATATASALPSAATTATTAALFRPVAALAVDRAVSARFEGHGCGLSTTGADHGRPRAHAGASAVTAALMLGVRGRVAATG
jgi:hypothetical protein